MPQLVIDIPNDRLKRPIESVALEVKDFLESGPVDGMVTVKVSNEED